MNDSSAVSALCWVLADVSLPLDSTNRKSISFATGVGPVASRTVEDVLLSYERAESIETMEGVLEGTGEMGSSVPPQETV